MPAQDRFPASLESKWVGETDYACTPLSSVLFQYNFLVVVGAHYHHHHPRDPHQHCHENGWRVVSSRDQLAAIGAGQEAPPRSSPAHSCPEKMWIKKCISFYFASKKAARSSLPHNKDQKPDVFLNNKDQKCFSFSKIFNREHCLLFSGPGSSMIFSFFQQED